MGLRACMHREVVRCLGRVEEYLLQKTLRTPLGRVACAATVFSMTEGLNQNKHEQQTAKEHSTLTEIWT